MTVPTTRSFTAGHFQLAIDGHKHTTYLKSFDGGWTKANVVDDPIGGQIGRIKHLSTVEIEPMSIELGMAGSTPVLEWIQQSWNRKFGRRSGQVTHADFNLKETFEHHFYDALLSEVTFPALDGAAKEPAYLKCKVVPETVVTKSATSGKEVAGDFTTKQKMWIPSAFRFTIDQFDGMEYTNKIESFTIKQGVKKMYVGKQRYAQLEPTNLQFPNITGTISLAHAGPLLKWHNEYVVKEAANKDYVGQLSGSLDFLTPDRATTIFSIELSQVGLLNASVVSATANTDQIKRVKFEMFVGSMKLDGGGALGLE